MGNKKQLTDVDGELERLAGSVPPAEPSGAVEQYGSLTDADAALSELGDAPLPAAPGRPASVKGASLPEPPSLPPGAKAAPQELVSGESPTADEAGESDVVDDDEFELLVDEDVLEEIDN